MDNAKPALIVRENEDEFGRIELWSTDSEDEEVRRPTHGECFVAKAEFPKYEGKCMMVHNDVSEQSGYSTDGGKTLDNCFATKPVSVHIIECEKVISKVHSIIVSLNIHVTRYEN